MEEIVIKDSAQYDAYYDLSMKPNDEGLITLATMGQSIVIGAEQARQLADAIYKLLGIDIEREAFEAGREGTNEAPCGYEYPSFTDYQNRDK